MIRFEDDRMMTIPTDFIYRIDPINNIEQIAAVGFQCGRPTRMVDYMNPANAIPETDWALAKGLRIPEEEHLNVPRVFFYLEVEQAQRWRRNWNRLRRGTLSPRWVLLRFSRQSPMLREDSLFFVDGACKAVDRAVYVAFPGMSVGDVIADATLIEIMIQKGEWMPLTDYVARRRINRAKREAKPPPQPARPALPIPQSEPKSGFRLAVHKLLEFIS